jgi:membrane-associated phospholipid phosphatase
MMREFCGMQHPRRFLGVMMICGSVSSLAAQEAATTDLTIRSDLPTETAVSAADSSAGSPSLPQLPAPLEASTAVAYRASDASGQVVGQPAGAAPTPRHTGIMAMVKGLGHDIVNLPSRENLLWVGIGTGLSLAVHPADSHVNGDLSGPTLHKIFEPGAILGQSYTLLGIAGTIYAVGRIKDLPKVSHTGMDLIRSVAIAELITESLKYTVRRERPDHSDTYSFPSGHSADTMAFATALERHFDWRFAVPAYLLASYVAMSRLQLNVHYLSDVTAGATVGIIAGRTVTRHGRENFPVTVMAIPGGGAVMYVRN